MVCIPNRLWPITHFLHIFVPISNAVVEQLLSHVNWEKYEYRNKLT